MVKTEEVIIRHTYRYTNWYWYNYTILTILISLVSSKLDKDMSRCRMLCECKYNKPWTTWRKMWLAGKEKKKETELSLWDFRFSWWLTHYSNLLNTERIKTGHVNFDTYPKKYKHMQYKRIKNKHQNEKLELTFTHCTLYSTSSCNVTCQVFFAIQYLVGSLL